MVEHRRFTDVRASDDGDEWKGLLFLAQRFFWINVFSRFEDELRCPSRYYRDSVPSSSHPVPHPVTGAAGFSLYQFFAPGGALSKMHPAYEFRRGQLQMAQAVEEALEEKRHLIVEAGTGTGKTLAYLNRYEEPAGATLL
jgi:hypothetical protein